VTLTHTWFYRDILPAGSSHRFLLESLLILAELKLCIFGREDADIKKDLVVKKSLPNCNRSSL